MLVKFEEWTGERPLPSFGTNAGATALPFQRWRHFKEAFAPEIVASAIRSSKIPVRRVLDPFGGSGTTALACQFLGVRPTTIEINPYLADLIEAKLTMYDCSALVDALTQILRGANLIDAKDLQGKAVLPATFIEPGVNARWIFDREAGERILALRQAIEALPNPDERRLFRVLLGGVLIELSNVIVNGKGRRYRRGWENRRRNACDVDNAFADAATTAIGEIDRLSRRQMTEFDIIRGDAREAAKLADKVDLAVFSPPYPNSFDYTDVYNVELWMLGYLNSSVGNRTLRSKTLSSHVQIQRSFGSAPLGSVRLENTLTALDEVRSELWSRAIPDMVGGYFHDMQIVINAVASRLTSGGSIWIVIGDSRYGGIPIASAEIIGELVSVSNLEVERIDTLRDMRTSAQQGGQHELAESLIVLRKG